MKAMKVLTAALALAVSGLAVAALAQSADPVPAVASGSAAEPALTAEERQAEVIATRWIQTGPPKPSKKG